MEIQKSSTMRELSNEELGMVGGGILDLDLGGVGGVVTGVLGTVTNLLGNALQSVAQLVFGLGTALKGLTNGLSL
jgi:hypothetical protein